MKLISCRLAEEIHIGVLDADFVRLPALSDRWQARYPDMLSLICAGERGLDELRNFLDQADDETRLPLAKVRLLPPIPRPRKNIVCMGWNYRDHITETAGTALRQDPLSAPIMFSKAASCVCGPEDEIPCDPDISLKMDWEVELGVIIGVPGHKISPEKALDHVFGYTIINDISARDLQKRHRQFYLGKSLPNACPMGPCIVSRDEIPDPQNLDIASRVNGQLKQFANTDSQIFSVATVISVLSKSPAVEAGDIIATGTPAGVGYTRTPPEYLRPGDVVECEIEKLGTLRNRVVQAPATTA